MTRSAKPNPLRPDARRRGAAYVVVLAVAVLVIIIGMAAITATRLTAQTSQLTNDAAEARLLARSAVELGLLHVKHNPGSWRQDFADGPVLDNAKLGRGTVTVTAYDPADDNLTNNTTQPAVIRGIGRIDAARAILKVTIDGDGKPIAGTWRTDAD